MATRIKGDLKHRIAQAIADAAAGTPAPGVAPLRTTQIGYASTMLAYQALQYREREGFWGIGNVAVVQYRDASGQLQTKAMGSGDDGHSETQLLQWLAGQGIAPEQITALYTEREPCSVPPSNCRSVLERVGLPSNVTVTYSYEYGQSEESRRRGNAQLAAELENFRPGGRREDASGDMGEQARARETSQADRTIAVDQVAALRDHFKNDPEATRILDRMQAGMSHTEIRKEFQKDPNTSGPRYDAALSRLKESDVVGM